MVAFLLGVAVWIALLIAYVVGVHKGILLERDGLGTDGGEGR